MKKILITFLMAALLISCSVRKSNSKVDNMSDKNTYDLVINGYDWGPGVDKIILHTEKSITPERIVKEDFKVTTETYGYNWTSWPPACELKKGERTITAVYLCDSNGNKVETECADIAVEVSVHPEDFLSNPFLYGSDMMNHWQEVYNVEITNEKLKIKITKEGKRISPLADQFKIGESTTDDITLHYGLWEPTAAAEKTPMVIWLHGMGEGGNDPYIALLGNKVVNLITDDVQKCFGPSGAYILAPQVNGFWMQTRIDVPGMEGWITEKSELTKSYYTKALKNLIDEVVAANTKIDANRIYIGGCSNGGYMTMNMLMEYPDFFAAAYPVCEAFPDSRIEDEKIKSLTKQHIWFTQSKDDKTVNPKAYVLPTYNRLIKEGAKDVHLSLWENVSDTTGNFKDKSGNPYKYNGHFSWVYTLNNQCEENGISVFEWMSKISK